jgi:general secretion pathway protein H
VELIVVMVILSLAAVLVVPRLPTGSDDELRRSARGLAATLRYLTEHAVTAREVHRLRFDFAANTVKITRRLPSGDEAPPGDTLLGRRLLGTGIVLTDLQTPRFGTVTEGEVTVDVGAGGLGEVLTLHLKGAREQFFTVVAFPASGKVKVLEGYQEYRL